MNHHLKSNCENVDASIFSGDVLYDDAGRAELKEYVARWARAVAEHEEQERAEPVAPAVQEPVRLRKDASGVVWVHFDAPDGRKAALSLTNVVNDKLERSAGFTAKVMCDALTALSATPPAPAQPAAKITEEMHVAAVRTLVRCTGNDEWPQRVWDAMHAAQPSTNPSKPEQAEAPKAGNAEPVARIEFRRGEAGRENEMPRVISCNWLPDGVYEVYLATLPPASAAGEREAFEAEFPIPEGMVYWDGDKYGVLPDYENSYRADRYCGQWRAWQARSALATKPQAEQPLASSDPEGHRQAIADHEADTEPSKPEQAEAPSDDEPLTPEQEEWVMDLAEKHNLGRRVSQIGTMRGVASDVFYTDASYRTGELFSFAAELLSTKEQS